MSVSVDVMPVNVCEVCPDVLSVLLGGRACVVPCGLYPHDSLNDRGLRRVAGDDDAVGGQGLMGAEPEGPVVLSAAGADFPLPPSMQPAARTEGAGDGGRDARVGDKASAPAGPALAAPLLVPEKTDVTVTALSGLLWLSWSSMAGCIVEGLLPRLSCLSLSYHPALVRLRLL
jgi:hypothetical protein